MPSPSRRLEDALDVLDLGYRTGDVALWSEGFRRVADTVDDVPPGEPVVRRDFPLVRDAALHGPVAGAERVAAVRVLRAVVVKVYADAGHHAALLAAIGDVVLEAAREDGDAELVDEAITFSRQALDVPGAPAVPRIVAGTALADALVERHRHRGDAAALDDAVVVLRTTENEARRFGDPQGRALCLRSRARCLPDLYELRADASLLDEAVRALDDALDLDGDAPTAKDQAELGRALIRRFRATGVAADSERAVDVLTAAVDATPSDSPDLAGLMSDLAAARSAAHENGVTVPGGRPGTIDVLRRAVEASGPDAPGRSLYISNLGTELHRLYEETRDSTVLREAIRCHHDGLADTSPRAEVARDRPRRLINLASALHSFYYRFDDVAALEEAIAALREALRHLPEQHPERVHSLNNLGTALAARFSAPGGRPEHLTEEIDVLRAALDLLPEGHPDRTSVENNLAIQLYEQDRRDVNETTVRHACDMTTRRALERDHEEVPAHLADLAPDAPLDRAQADEAVRLARAVLKQTQPNHPRRPVCLLALGLALRNRATGPFGERNDIGDLAEARALFEEVAGDSRTDPSLRALAGLDAALLAVADNDWPAAADLYRTVVAQLPLLVPRELGRTDQEDELGPFSGVAGDAAMAALRAGAGGREAMRVLEQGRGVLLAQAMHSHDVPATESAGSRAYAATEGGPVVALVLGQYGCAALAATSDTVTEILLPKVSGHEVVVRAGAFRTALDVLGAHGEIGFTPENWSAADRVADDTLAWLWDAVAAPVLDELSLPAAPVGGDLPRLWWMPTGMLSFLPLHAAGYHRRGDRCTVLDNVVSSYTPTLGSLTWARGHTRPSVRPQRPLVIAVSADAAGRGLPAARPEADRIRAVFPHSELLLDDDARCDAVLGALPTSDWVHFACHAESVLDDPSASHLLLTDGSLSVREVGSLHNPRAHLAYLSACGTGRGGTSLIDEAIHVSSAFQLAGYPHVIATLWSIADQDALTMADRVYTTLIDSPETGPARALHAAVCRARDDLEGRHPVRWAAHVHAGP